MFEEKVEQLVNKINIPIVVEEILLDHAKEEGLEKGLAKGRKEEREKANQKLKEAVRNMLKEGFSKSVICKVLEVSEDFVLDTQTGSFG